MRSALLVLPVLVFLAVAGAPLADPTPALRESWRVPAPAELAEEWRNHSEDRYAMARGCAGGSPAKRIAPLGFRA